jgi:hypothetical protein
MKRLLLFGCFLTLLLGPRPSRGEDFLVIFDLSGSMGLSEEIEPAKEALRRVMDDVPTPGASWGLRIYGAGCGGADTCLEIPLSSEGRKRIREILPSLEAGGPSPMPEALRAARTGELTQSNAWRQNAIVISDGLVDREEACREARLLREDGVRVLVIGLEFSGTPEGRETLRYVAEDPDCAAGTYIRADRPDLVGVLMRRLATQVYGFPFRLIALALALAAGYYTTLFFEYVLERRTNLRREQIPPLCRSLFLLLSVTSAGLFLTGGAFGLLLVLAGVLIVGLASTFTTARLMRGGVGRT